jgi:hypothetical protein
LENLNFTKQEEKGLNILAKHFAFNYFNVSLTKNNPEDTNSHPTINPSTILEYSTDKKAKKEWCRNILIVGSGVSKSSFEFIPLGSEVVQKIEEKLGIQNISVPGIKNLIRKYIKLAELYKKEKYDLIKGNEQDILKSNLKTIRNKLFFEGRMSLLTHFFDKEDIIDELKEQLDYRSLPSLFYEIIAHLFKHKFIDIIINFNFDELLDNAIEDELGEGMYHRIVSDGDFLSMDQIMDNNRLKTPIYIKPHGTISSESSMLFTKEQYIEMSEKVKILITDLLHGKLSDSSENKVKHFNFIVAGFNMESIEFNDILKQQFKEIKSNKIKKINYFIFNPEAGVIIKKFKRENNIKSSEKVRFYNFDSKSPKNQIRLSDLTEPFYKDYNTAKYFIKIYEYVRKRFKIPFKPSGINRHRILNFLFPHERFELEMENRNTWDKFLCEYYKRRTIFLILYEALKYKGIIHLPTISNDRASKYFWLYLEKIKENNKIEIDSLNLISLMKPSLDLYLKKDADSDMIYSSRILESKEYRNDDKKARYIYEKMLENSLIDKDDTAGKLFEQIEGSYNKGANEINPKYKDPKLTRLNWFSVDQVLSTNLALTYKFFEFAALRMEDWDEMKAVDRTCKAVFNLSLHCDQRDSEQDHLFRIFKRGNTINFLYSDEFVHEKEPVQELIENIKQKADNNKAKFKCKEFRRSFKSHHMHYMYLFFKKGFPIFGIYHFKPRGKNRINPIFFDITEKGNGNINNDKKNLEIMSFLYDWQSGKVKNS